MSAGREKLLASGTKLEELCELIVDCEHMSLPRFRGHLLKGGYDGQDGKEWATGTTAVQ